MVSFEQLGPDHSEGAFSQTDVVLRLSQSFYLATQQIADQTACMCSHSSICVWILRYIDIPERVADILQRDKTFADNKLHS